MKKRGSRREAVRTARRANGLAQRTVLVEHQEDARAREIVQARAATRILDMLAPEDRPRAPVAKALRAILIINSKSGPKHDSLLRVGELVDMLAGHGISADVRVKLHKSQARREARAAARAKVPLVIAAGGDGTVAAVARGLVGSQTVLGVIPLGTYNNVATSLGIPTDITQACALIAAAPVRAIDVGEVSARGMKRPRQFLEVGAIGIAAPLAIAGQGFEKGRWDAVTKHLPSALEMSPAILGVRVDGQRPVHRAFSMLAIVANTPRAGAGLLVAPQAKLDDGLLDVRIYEEMTQAILATHFVAIKTGIAAEDLRVRRWSGRNIVLRSHIPLPVVVDSKVVGMTPARFRVLSGALLAIVGHGDALSRPTSPSLLTSIVTQRETTPPDDVASQVSAVGVSAGATRSVGPSVARQVRPLGLALAAGATLAAVPALSRWIDRRRRHTRSSLLGEALAHFLRP